MHGMGKKGNLGLEIIDERLTTEHDGLMPCQALGASTTWLREMEIGGCGSVLCPGQVNSDVSLKFPSRLSVALWFWVRVPMPEERC